MKILIAFGLALAMLAVPVSAQVQVRGYYKADGTYVEPHVRSAPNDTKADNYNTPGNYNPNTGRVTPQPQPRSTPSRSTTTTTPCYYNCPR